VVQRLNDALATAEAVAAKLRAAGSIAYAIEDAEVVYGIRVQAGSNPGAPGTGEAAIFQAGIEATS
jgi:hypothetical protein